MPKKIKIKQSPEFKKTKDLDDSLDLILILGSLGLEDYYEDFADCTLAIGSDIVIYKGLKAVDIYNGDVIILRVDIERENYPELDIILQGHPDLLEKKDFRMYSSYKFKAVDI